MFTPCTSHDGALVLGPVELSVELRRWPGDEVQRTLQFRSELLTAGQATGPQLVSTENSMSVVQMSQGVLDPASPALLSEPAIVAREGVGA